MVRGAGLALALQVSGAGLAFLVQVLLARWMGAAEYGVYAFVFAGSVLAAMLVGLGLPNSALRFVAAYRAQADWARLRGVLRAAPLMASAAGLAFGVVGTAAVLALHAAGPLERVGPPLAGVWLVPLLALLDLLREMSRASRRIALAYAPPLLGRPALIIGAGGVLLAVSGDLTGTDALLVTLAAVATVGCVQLLGFRRTVATGVPDARPRYELGHWLRVSGPLLLSGGFTLVIAQADVLMVGALLGTRESGLYNAASKTALLVSFILLAVNATAAPAYASLHARRQRDAMQKLASRLAHWAFWPSLVIALAMVALADPILRLFGAEFTSASTPLIVLVLAQLLAAGAGSVGHILNVTNHQVDSARVSGAVAAINLGLCAVCIPLFGLVGAALATGVSIVLWNVWMHSVVRRKVGVRPSILSALAVARRGSAPA